MTTAIPNAARLLVIGAVLMATLASSSSQSEHTQVPGPTFGAPPPTAMDPAMALGLWRSSFGPVKIEADETGGPTAVVGVWSYDRQGEQVVGYFQGSLNGNVLEFTWHEPNLPADLTGAGWVVFDVAGQRFDGKWWSQSRDRQGAFTGERAPGAAVPGAAPAPGPAGPAPGPGGVEPAGGEAEPAPPESI